MPVFRVEKNRDYTTMSNFHLRDKELSLKAKGLLSQILSLPEDWNYTVSGLAAINKESRDCIRSAITELEASGYIERRRERSADGKLGDMEYLVYERPMLENPTLEKPALENPPQQITEKTKEKIAPMTEGREAPVGKYGTYQNVFLKAEELSALQSAYPKDYEQKIDRLSEYMRSSGRSYRDHYLTICQWAKRDAERRTIKKAAGEDYTFKEGESY